MTTTASGVANTEVTGPLSEEGAVDAFLARFTDASPKEPSEGADTGTYQNKKKVPQESNEAEVDEASSDESPEETEDQPAKKYTDDDETYVKIKVGDEEHEVPVKDLKRVWGQEAALTRKSQEVADQRKKADAETAKAVASLNALCQRATEKSNPYKQVDWLVAAKELSAEELSLLRAEATRAVEEEKFLKTELDGFMQAIQQRQATDLKTQAQACTKALTDPSSPQHIEGWNDALYNELRTFAVAEGIDQNVVNQLVDAPTIKLLHMALQFKRGASKTVVTNVNKTPKKIVKTTATPAAADPTRSGRDKAMVQLRNKQTVDAAAEAFLANWKDTPTE